MRDRLTLPVLVFAVVIASVGCGPLARLDRAPFGEMPPRLEAAACAEGAGLAPFLVLGAKEGKDIGEMEAPAERKPGTGKGEARAGGFTLKVGGGLTLPGTDQMGSSPDRTVDSAIPAYSDVWTPAGAFEAVGEFGGGKKIRFYAQLAFSKFEGQKWTSPSNPDDTWLASTSSLTLVAGGVRFGGSFYGKAALGFLMWPEVSRVDHPSGSTEPIIAPGATGAAAFGGGAEFKLGRLKAYVDAEFFLAAAPAKGENAVVFWPEFEGQGMGSFKLACGVGFTF